MKNVDWRIIGIKREIDARELKGLTSPCLVIGMLQAEETVILEIDE